MKIPPVLLFLVELLPFSISYLWFDVFCVPGATPGLQENPTQELSIAGSDLPEPGTGTASSCS